MAPVWRSAHGHEHFSVLQFAARPRGRWNFARRALERHARRAALREVRIGSWERHVFITDVRASSDGLRRPLACCRLLSSSCSASTKLPFSTNFEKSIPRSVQSFLSCLML